MKLNNAKIVETIRKRNNGWSTNHIRKKFEVTERRVNQVLFHYKITGEAPVISKKIGRPSKKISDKEIGIVLECYNKYRFSASLLEPILQRDYKIHIPHNRIHKILLTNGKAKKLDSEVIRRRFIVRYERKHSLSLGHMDWHQRPNDGIWVGALEDDASRALLSLLETDSPTAAASAFIVKQATQAYGKFRQIITDRGSQFTCNHKGFVDSSSFEQHLQREDIEHIRCRPKHPQTNGKVEKWFDTYERHRDAFKGSEEFRHWYNVVRPHTALKWGDLETPMQAFGRKFKK